MRLSRLLRIIGCLVLMPSVAFASATNICLDGPILESGLPLSGGTMSGDLDMGGNGILDAGSVELDGGATWTPGTDDDSIILQETGVAADNVCLKTSNDVFAVYQGNCSTRAQVSTARLYAFGEIESSQGSGGALYLSDTTTIGTTDGTGLIDFEANNDGSLTSPGQETMARIEMDVTDATEDTEDADLVLSTMANGTLTEMLRLDGSLGGVQIGTGGAWIAGTTDDMICLQEVDTAADQTCIKTTSDNIEFRTGTGSAYTTATAANFSASGGQFTSLSGTGGVLELRDSTNPGTGAEEGYIYFKAYDDASNLTTMAQIEMDVTDATDTAEDADLIFKVIKNGTLIERFRVDGDTGITATADVFVDSGAGGTIYLTDTTATGDASGAGNIYLRAKHDGSLTSPANENMARIEMDVTDATEDTEDADLVLSTMANGTLTEMLRLDGDAGVAIPQATKLLFDTDLDTWVTAAADDSLSIYTGNNLRLSFANAGMTVRDDYPIYFGTGEDFWMLYDEATDDDFEFWTTDIDGGGTDGVVWKVDSGTDDVDFSGDITLPATGKLYLDGGGDTWIDEAAGNTIRFIVSNFARLQLTSDGATVKSFANENKGSTTTTTGAYEDLTTDGGAGPFTTSGLIPDGAILLGVTTRVTTALATCTDYSVGDGSDADLYGVAGAVTQGTTTDNSDATANWSNPQLAAGEVTITTTGTCDSGGVIRVVAHYITVTAPTSN